MKPFQSFSTSISKALPPDKHRMVSSAGTYKQQSTKTGANERGEGEEGNNAEGEENRTKQQDSENGESRNVMVNRDSINYDEPENFLEIEITNYKTHYSSDSHSSSSTTSSSSATTTKITDQSYSPQFTDYEIICRTNIPCFKKKVSKVRRRYSDFDYFRKCLIKELALSGNKASSKIVIPSLPGKIFLSNRFNRDCIETRRLDLQDWLATVAGHPLLQTGSKVLVRFVQEESFVG